MERAMLTLATLVVSLHGSFALSQVPRSALLTAEAPLPGTGILLAQDEALPPPPPGVAAPRTLQDLRAERARLDGTRPSLGGGIAMLAVGAALSLAGLGVGVGGLYMLVLYLFTSNGAVFGTTLATVFTVVGFVFLGVAVVALGVGIPLAVIGGRKLSTTIRERNAIGAQMNAIDEQIRQLEQLAPEAPPPPTSVERNLGPQPLLVLSTF
jgi:hypothetical protein